MVECRQAAMSMQWALGEGSGFLFPSVLNTEAEGNLAPMPAQMTSNPQTHLRAVGMEYGGQAVHVALFLGGGAPYGEGGHGRSRGVRWTEVVGRGQQT